jgi:hypothetical protein
MQSSNLLLLVVVSGVLAAQFVLDRVALVIARAIERRHGHAAVGARARVHGGDS